MPGKKLSVAGPAVLAILSTIALLAGTRVAAQETLLHSFIYDGKGGSNSEASLIVDAHGNLYGTTTTGGANSNCNGSPCGTVFELSPNPGGGWSETVLHNFGSGTDGFLPQAGMVFDRAGNLYGTTTDGGAYGLGTVFELSPAAGGLWTEKVLHSFNGSGDGNYPLGNLAIDSAGNLYGTTFRGGTNNGGIVFEVLPTAGESWTEKALHNFGIGTDGAYPWAGVILDTAGNLYGTAEEGGFHNGGVVFELVPQAGGSWTEKILYNFGAYTKDGLNPKGGVIFDAAGNLYGTTYDGGTIRGEPCPSCGTVFQLTPTTEGGWTERVIHIFGVTGGDGYNPTASLVIDAAGKLYGTTSSGGRDYNGGTVFELTPAAGGAWTESVLYSFARSASTPLAGLILDSAGNLYGTTYVGGVGGNGGTVFEVKP